MDSSIEIQNRIHTLRDQAATAVAEDRVEDAARIGGRIDQLDDQLTDQLKVEADMRANGAVPVAASNPSFRPRNVAQAFLGDPRAFTELGHGKVNVTDAITGIETPVITDPNIPAIQNTLFTGFLSTLASGTTEGDVKYMQAGDYTNAAAQWTSGKKAESSYTWVPKTAQLAWIAHQTPVQKPALHDYGQLEAVIDNELMTGLAIAEDANALLGNNADGITGVCKTTGIQTYTAKTKDTLADSIRRMKTLSLAKSGLMPDHVAMAPEVHEELDLLKETSGAYLNLTMNGTVWALPIVDDINLSVTSGTTTNHGMLLYAGMAATWFTSATNAIEVGTVDSQFIENAVTLLAEGEHALKVTYPKSFVYLAAATTETTA